MVLEQRVAVVTGGASGIGEEICRQFSREGATVIIADLNGESAQKLAGELKAAGRAAAVRCVDIRDTQKVKEAADQTADEFGTIDVLVNCAGYNKFVAPDEVTPDLWDRFLSVNLDGSWNFAAAVMPYMMRQQKGKIINIGSAAAVRANPKCLPYVVAKHGIVGLTRALAVDLGPYQINVNCICPGPIETPLFAQSTTPEFARQIRERIPLDRLGKPRDIASAAVFLASCASDFITGVILPVDGGLVCCNRAHHYE